MAKLESEKRNQLSGGDFAFPKQREAPLEDASHARKAVARFDQVKATTSTGTIPPSVYRQRLNGTLQSFRLRSRIATSRSCLALWSHAPCCGRALLLLCSTSRNQARDER